MVRARSLALVVLLALLGFLAGCEPCTTTTLQTSQATSQVSGGLRWHDASGDTAVTFWPVAEGSVPVVYGGGMFDIFFEIPGKGSRALMVFAPDLEDSEPGSHSLEDFDAFITPIEPGGQSASGAVETLSLKGTLAVSSIEPLSVDATFDISDSGETGPRGSFRVVYSASQSQGQCVRGSLY